MGGYRETGGVWSGQQTPPGLRPAPASGPAVADRIPVLLPGFIGRRVPIQ
ncbi:hypothetical protein GCM10007079_31770 [Nocardiopsis terrae]|nr:hypothetical protein GCM10007079_31770 [Nocardiopsis terrae]